MTMITTKSLPSSPRDPGALPHPSAAEVIELQEVQEYPAVSVLCTTEPAPRLPAADGSRLLALVDQATARLEDEFNPRAAREVRDRLHALAADAAGRPSRFALALYASPSHASAWSLLVPVADRAVVDPTFATRDLIRSLHRTPLHVVLVLTEREARLFEAAAQGLLPPVGTAFPLSTDGRTSRNRRRASQRAGDPTHPDADAFLRTVDRALGTYLRLHPAPLILVGAQRTLARFVALSRNTGRLAGTIHGSHAWTPLPVLAGLTRPVLDRYLHSRQHEAVALLEARASADAVDELIEIVLRRGGWIALTDDGALGAYDRVALVVRRDS